MNHANNNNNNKAQKGWLSRWTRKQWSRHWFVLKNGSLTYYRGPAAELCSFLDGVLDLSLIKHIEVQQEGELSAHGATQQQQHQQQQHYNQQNNHYHYHHLQPQPTTLVGPTINNQSSNSNNNTNNGQFTFSLKMWNGECHLLGAASVAERSLWLEAINACINGEPDDDAATDSASSSDSSPTSNLSAKSTDIGRPSLTIHSSVPRQHYALNTIGDTLGCKLALSRHNRMQQQQNSVVEKQLNSSSAGNNVISAIRHGSIELQDKRKLQQPDTVLTSSFAHSRLANSSSQRPDEAMRNSSSHKVDQALKSCDNDEDGEDVENSGDDEDVGDDDEEDTEDNEEGLGDVDNDQANVNDNQALKRRLVSITSRIPIDSNEPLKLVARQQQQQQQQTSADLYPRNRVQIPNKSCNNTTDQNQEEDQEMGSSSSTSSTTSPADSGDEDGDIGCALPSATSSSQNLNCQDSQEKPMSLEKQKKRVTFDLSLSSLHQLTSSSESSCTSGSDDSDSSLISSSSSVSSEDEEDLEHLPQAQQQPLESSRLPVALSEPNAEAQPIRAEGASDGEQVALESTCRRANEAGNGAIQRRAEELEMKLDEAQGNIGILERKLSGSYASYNQLEANYKRLQAELSKCEELHKCDLNRMQLRVDELTKELTASQLKLVETRDKLIKYEEHLAKHQSGTNNQNQPRTENYQQQEQHHNHQYPARSNTQARALNWLKSSQQASGNLAQLHQHQPLLFMHHVKHTLAVNQQTLGLKLLNHSKQIQKKLNELELKVDQIQSTTTNTTATPLVN